MLSVLLATHNGADTIERTLAAMSEMTAPPGGWKLIVVNNASTDDTEARVLKWRDRLPLDYVVETALGKSKAINTGLARAEGDFIIMTDDDVLPSRGWLTEWRRIADAYPQCAIFGGAIVPEFDGSPPAWPMPEGSYAVLYGETLAYPEGEIGHLKEAATSLNVFGANLAIRRAVHDQGWRFGEDFLVGTNGLMGEDADFARRLWATGAGVGFAPTAVVRHIVHREQTSWWWIQKRFLRHGRTMFMLDDVRHDAQSGRLEFSFPRWRIRRAAGLIAKLALAGLTWNRAQMFTLCRRLAYEVGALQQARALSRQAGR